MRRSNADALTERVGKSGYTNTKRKPCSAAAIAAALRKQTQRARDSAETSSAVVAKIVGKVLP